MSKRKKDVQRIEDALIFSRRKPVKAEVGPFWQAEVMSRILREGASGKALSGNGSKYSGTVWRFALATCLIAILLGAYLMDSDLEIQYQMTELILDDSAGMYLAGSFTSL